ncbi:helix-turn-helix domain-containing protein [Sporosarcina sp. FA9]|uniref:helix-turn-helix domain-containing protein n=1 Tax=Sporosarcina sp. FA9 TaxID=3413030 RepID=UPI003F65951D
MSVGNRIKQLRKNLRLTQKQLADKVNVSPQVISNWEREYTEPGSEDIKLLSKVLNRSADYILGDRNTSDQIGHDEEGFQNFINDPELNRWYKELPKSEEDDLRKLRKMWDIIKNDDNKSR